MARLPTVGGDADSWGSLLNEYLQTSHNSDGTLKLDVKTIADLKAIAVAALGDKQQALVAGYYAPGDGGGGQFYYDGGSAATDNGGTIIAPNAGSGRWRRAYSGAVNVRWFGAKGDNVTDDTAAIQAAINENASVFIPAGRYVISNTLDVTNRSVRPFSISGEGWTETGSGSVLYAQTGGVAVDCTGSQFLSMRDLSIVSQGRPSPATIGVLLARGTTPASSYCQFATLKNVFIHIASDTTAHGGRGTVGVYNNAAEIHNYENLYAVADTPLVVASNNPWGVTSAYQTINGSLTSTSQVILCGASTLRSKSATGHCAYFHGVFGVELQNVYMKGAGTGAGTCAIYARSCRRFRMSAHIESSDRIAHIENGNDLTLDITLPSPTAYAPIFTGSVFTTLNKLDLNIELAEGAITTWPMVIEGLSTSSINVLCTNLGGDDGSVPLTNILNVQGVFRKVKSAMLKKGGYRDLHLVGACVCETWLTFDAQGPTGVPNNSLFRDTDGRLKYKDHTGFINVLY